ncbi:glycosyltransferase family 2 protein [Deefgea rivuli]|uniref:glycosyltransferase family 2 protein n=1 Tax=Deefgea rivuli TaxID=400948 RepID=UPI0004860134|nr:glycosyltransferase [Deefgea rivuli]
MPIVSVIIPTHNRAHYVIPTIKALLGASDELEVIVSDTSDIDLISSQLVGVDGLNRLNLIRPMKKLNVVENFNLACRAATGEFLVFIGDDDLVHPSVIDIAKYAKLEEIDSIKFSHPALYYWPDFMHARKGDAYSGALYISAFTGQVKPLNARGALDEALHNFGAGVLNMPRAYAGMISHSLAKRIQAKYGELFGGVSPDIFSSALISLESSKCVTIDYPAIIPGASGASTAGQSANGTHVGALRDNAHIGAFKDLVWDERIPEFYSVPTVWSFSLLKAIDCANYNGSSPDFYRLYAKCFIFHRYHNSITLTSLRSIFKADDHYLKYIKLFSGFFLELLDITKRVGLRLFRFTPVSAKTCRVEFKNTHDVCKALNSEELRILLSPWRCP